MFGAPPLLAELVRSPSWVLTDVFHAVILRVVAEVLPMTTVKTAISIDESLFDQVNDLAGKLQLPRSQVFALAVEEFVERWRSRDMLQTLNDVYANGPDDDEEALIRAMAQHERELLQNEW
jgi:hypothetical protein